MIVNVHKTRRFGDHVLLVHPASASLMTRGQGMVN